MKKFLLIALLGLSATAFGQICEVDMVNRYNRVVRTFQAYGDPNTCLEGMKECRKTIRLQPHLGGVDCIRAGSLPQPNPQPIPNPRPNPRPDVSYYLSLRNDQLAHEALRGIGLCKVDQGNWNSSCQFYAKVRGYGYPQGTGCAKYEYTYQYGCTSSSELNNAGCIIRLALQNGECF